MTSTIIDDLHKERGAAVELQEHPKKVAYSVAPKSDAMDFASAKFVLLPTWKKILLECVNALLNNGPGFWMFKEAWPVSSGVCRISSDQPIRKLFQLPMAAKSKPVEAMDCWCHQTSIRRENAHLSNFIREVYPAPD